MLNPLGIRTGISAFVDDVDDLFGGDDTEGRPTSEPPEPAVDYHTLFDDDPPVKAVIGSGLNGVEKVLQQPSLVEDAADPRFPAFQQAWREGKPFEDLLGEGPFGLKARIAGNGGDNWRPDVAKVQVLLNKAGYHTVASEEGPNGYHSRALDDDIRRFQRDNKLAVDGKLSSAGVRRLIDNNDLIRRKSIENLVNTSDSQKKFSRGWNDRLDRVKRMALEYADKDTKY